MNEVNFLNETINSLEPKSIVPFTKKVAWGYGNLINNKDIIDSFLIDNLINYVKPFLAEGRIECNHFLAVDKAPFIGPDVEWHQEFFNINTFAPGYEANKDLDCFIQIFSALDFHNSNNGPLMVFKGSHKEGLLPFEDIINPNLGHKRRVRFEDLVSLNKKYELVDIILSPGDAVFFNHLLVHGSPTNTSPNRRRAALFQFRVNKRIKNEDVYKNEISYRTKFIINQCQDKINKLLNANPYSDMK